MSKCVFDTILYIYDGISKMLDNRNYSNRVVIDKNIKITLILIVLFVMFLILHSNSKIQYLDILPSTSIFHTKPKYLKEIFKSRQLYIRESNLTNEYLRYIRPVIDKEDIKSKTKNIGLKFDESYFEKRIDQLGFAEFGRLCTQEELLSPGKITLSSRPYISIIIPSFNKEKNLVKSIRSIQNQSLKNIEIIIVDDCSTYQSSILYKTLLKSDPRIRVFTHLTNMGLWRTRIDGFLYSRGKYIMTLDPDDLYEDNYVLEDLYNLMEKYDLDTAKTLFRLFYDYNNFTNYKLPFEINYNSTEIVGKENITRYNSEKLHWAFGVIWNRITRSDVLMKGLLLLSDNVLNLYKNFCEDQWWNRLGDQYSNNFLIVQRVSYLFYQDEEGQSRIKTRNDEERDRMVQEFIIFLYFDYDLLPKEDNKKDIINQLNKLHKTNKRVKLDGLRTKFYLLDNLLNRLGSDPYVSNDDKIYVYKLLVDSIKRQNKLLNNKK